MLIAQISDLHVKAEGKLAYGMVDTAGMLRNCVANIMRQIPLPDVVLIPATAWTMAARTSTTCSRNCWPP